MIGAEKGFLLLCSHLGDPTRKVLTTAQLRILATRVQMAGKPGTERELEISDLIALGYGRATAAHIWGLLQQEEVLRYYCRKAERQDCFPMSRISPTYPAGLSEKLGEESTACLWYRGDVSLLAAPKVSLVGSRDILSENRIFAEEVGRQAALQGYVLVSGNARGADRCAQRACLSAGGRVISVVADGLTDKRPNEGVLYLSEDEFDAPFTAQRAISRNRLIHCLSEKTFVAQCGLQTGGTWDGTAKNLRHGWSDVYGLDDGSSAMKLLAQMGAELIDCSQLTDFAALPQNGIGFLEDF